MLTFSSPSNDLQQTYDFSKFWVLPYACASAAPFFGACLQRNPEPQKTASLEMPPALLRSYVVLLPAM